MTEEKKKIGCPKCGAVLAVKMIDGIEGMTITCPICKNARKFGEYREIKVANETTQIMGAKSENEAIGQLVSAATGFVAQLKEGRNVVGRNASSSEADIPVPAPSKRMSREHLVIDVKRVEGTGMVHYASLYKEAVNPTYIGETMLEYGDCVILKDGDVVKLPDYDLRFEIPDEEKTETCDIK